MMSTFTPADWRDIRLVAFDVDGTLYRQCPLRLRMGCDMVLHSVAKCDLNAISVVSAYRRIRERLAAEEGVFAGSSAGAMLCAAVDVARELGAGKRVVTVIPDSAERYLSKGLLE